jgi:hypothetical protein
MEPTVSEDTILTCPKCGTKMTVIKESSAEIRVRVDSDKLPAKCCQSFATGNASKLGWFLTTPKPPVPAGG